MKKFFVFILTLGFLFISSNFVLAENNLAQQNAGKILLQVQQNGEAYYVYPNDNKRYYLGSPENAWSIMRFFGIGISNPDLQKIPTGIDQRMTDNDSDGDGLSDDLEKIFGTHMYLPDTDHDGYSDSLEIQNNYDPLNCNGYLLPIDYTFTEKKKGKIFLQVESHGEAWYVNPQDGKKYYMGRPADALKIMQYLGLGIADQNLNLINENNLIDFSPENLDPKYQDADVTLDLNRLNSGTYSVNTHPSYLGPSAGYACYQYASTEQIKSGYHETGSYKYSTWGMLEFYNPLPKSHKAIIKLRLEDKNKKVLDQINYLTIIKVKYENLSGKFEGYCSKSHGFEHMVFSDEKINKQNQLLKDGYLYLDVSTLVNQERPLNQLAINTIGTDYTFIKNAQLLLFY